MTQTHTRTGAGARRGALPLLSLVSGLSLLLAACGPTAATSGGAPPRRAASRNPGGHFGSEVPGEREGMGLATGQVVQHEQHVAAEQQYAAPVGHARI